MPDLGWILPSGELVSELSAPSLLVLSKNVTIVIAKKSGAIPAGSVEQFIKKQKVDCDGLNEPSSKPLYRYVTGLPATKTTRQVFVLNAPPAKIQSSSLTRYKPSAAEEAVIWKDLNSSPSGKRSSQSIAVPGSQVFYTIAATYNRKGIIIRSGIFLENHSAQILGKEIDDVQGEEECDGCGVATIQDGINVVYPVLSVLQFPGLAYPVLLADTSTVEGRATELFTFSPKGEPSRFRLYEYMVTCILGSADEQAKPSER